MPTRPVPPRPVEDLLVHAAWLRRLAARLVASPQEADDIVQEVWRATLAAKPEAVRSPRAWLAGAARNVVKMRLRGDGRRQKRDEQAARVDAVPSAAELASEQEVRKLLLEHVDKLPEDERNVVLARFWRDLPPRKAAKELGIPVNTVRSRTARALQRLRTQLDEQRGGRKAWCLALVPLLDAKLLRSVGAAPKMAAASKLGVAAGVVAAIGGGSYAVYSELTAYEPLDLRQHSAPIEALASFDRPVAPDAGALAGPVERAALSGKSDPSFGGVVVDRSGKPIDGAYVHRGAEWFRAWIRYGKIRAEDWSTTSGADGQFALPASAFAFWRPRKEIKIGEVTHPDYVAELGWSDWPLDADARIVMRRAYDATLEIEVVEKGSGLPVPRFEVGFESAWGQRTRLPGGGTISPDASYRRLVSIDGRDLLQHGENGKLRRSVRLVADGKNELRVRVRGARNIRELVDVPSKHGTVIKRRYEVVLDGSARVPGNQVVRGVAVDLLTGAPIPGAYVKLGYGPGASATTARADGSFALGFGAEKVPKSFSVTHPDYVRQGFPFSLDALGTEQRLQVLPLATLTVQVQDRGVPAAGVHVLLRHPKVGNGPGEHRGITDARGIVAFARMPIDAVGIYLVPGPMDPDEKAIESARVSLQPGEARTYTFDFDAPDRVQVSGRVAAAAASASTNQPRLLPIFVPVRGEGGWVRARPVGGAGYDAGGLPRGRYVVLLVPSTDDHRDGPFAFCEVLDVRAPVTQVADLILPTGTVRGQIAGLAGAAGGGKGVGSVRVVAIPDLAQPSVATQKFLSSNRVTTMMGAPLDRAGNFQLPHIADGAWRLEVRRGATVLAHRTVIVAKGGLDLGVWTMR